jgi:hypothetical protein
LIRIQTDGSASEPKTTSEMKARIFFFGVFMAATAIAAERWWSADKFYSIVPPAGWKHGESKAAAGSSYAFTSPDGQSEVRVSATYHLNLPDLLPEDVLGLAFPNERGLAPIKRIRGKGWDGLRREYTNAQYTKHWLGVAARRGSTAVLLIMVAPEKDFERYRPAFEAVIESLELGQ